MAIYEASCEKLLSIILELFEFGALRWLDLRLLVLDVAPAGAEDGPLAFRERLVHGLLHLVRAVGVDVLEHLVESFLPLRLLRLQLLLDVRGDLVPVLAGAARILGSGSCCARGGNVEAGDGRRLQRVTAVALQGRPPDPRLFLQLDFNLEKKTNIFLDILFFLNYYQVYNNKIKFTITKMSLRAN